MSVLDENLFSWKGRTLSYCLPSGMDDDPRAQILTDQEAHLGLQSWMIISTRTLARVATILGKAEDAVAYKLRQTKIEANLNANFWDESRQLYDDWYLDETGNKQFVGHTGYLNFFPFFLNVIPQEYSERFISTFEKLIDPATGLWSEFGVRSLSIYDPYYRLGDDYWTSPIWMNINYLIWLSLHQYDTSATVDHTLKVQITSARIQLRMNLVNMIVSQYVNTGFIWEVYDDLTGDGLDNHPFTGWSALVVNILAERY